MASLEGLDADRSGERPAVARLDALRERDPEADAGGGDRPTSVDRGAEHPRGAPLDGLDAPGPSRPVALFDDADLAGDRPAVRTARFDGTTPGATRRPRRVASDDGPREKGSGAARSSEPGGRPVGRRRTGGASTNNTPRQSRRAAEPIRDADPHRAAGEPAADADPEAVARSICLRLLTDRARTRQELAQALRKRGVPDDAANAVLERFSEVGLIDDAAFAEQWVRSRHSFRGLGRRAIAVELRRKGVDEETAGEALAEVDAEAEERRARELIDRKLRTLRGTPDEAAARRLLGMLARKGYPAGIAYRVVREALAEHASELAEQLLSGEDD
ncbi:recombination regulator RecX [Pseudonocardia asaccharolytica]|uniref:Regulatory protein RecX n=1 Tax=Pseudonocardia asaccharolytica DSM 44247 = NBRC 16224 TaxID=1123024 RepID=A0A511D129_9PSEU|nr:recombination regulator RecX [Pseudonocardia asaccharolytica]GEL18509.1 hypothetical protein PA7_23460 [Pseudonocardia asaccharolytica DSM 44247 = NBRC 16224]